MKHLRLFEYFDTDIDDINEICYRNDIKHYTINPDGSIDVNEDVSFRYHSLKKLPLKFNKINGNFYCKGNQRAKLTSLEGSPVEVNGSFFCNRNRLTSFEFSPKIIRGDFDCEYNNIKTFEYFPSYVKSRFWCKFNPVYEVWDLFRDTTKIELLNDFDIFRDEDTDQPAIVMDRLNDFLLTIGRDSVEKVDFYKNI
jgi:hypothetical protein